MATLEIRPADARVSEILANLRASDYADLELSPAELLRVALARSCEAWEAIYDGEVAVVWGFIPGDVFQPAKIWMLTTPIVDRARFTFLIESRRFIASAISRFGVLSVIATNSRSERWLRWLGFAGDPLTLRLS